MTCGLGKNCPKTIHELQKKYFCSPDPTPIWNYVAKILTLWTLKQILNPFLSSHPNFSSGWDPNLFPPPPPTTLTILGPDDFAAGKNIFLYLKPDPHPEDVAGLLLAGYGEQIGRARPAAKTLHVYKLSR